MKHEESCYESQRQENVQNQMPGSRDGNEQPSNEKSEQQSVPDELDRPEPPIAEAYFQRIYGRSKTRHHFTSTTAASLVAKMAGRYIG